MYTNSNTFGSSVGARVASVHERIAASASSVTASLNVIRIGAFVATLVAPSAGVVESTDGASSPGGDAAGVSVKSSTASPSSELVALKSVHLIQIVEPEASERPPIEPVFAVRLAAALPSINPTVPVVVGATK